MMEEFVRKANSGSFKKGNKPWNKGTKGVTGRGMGKGHQGYQPRPVIALNPDGTICKKFPSVKAAQEYFGLRDYHSIIGACQQKFFARAIGSYTKKIISPGLTITTIVRVPGTSTDDCSKDTITWDSESRLRKRCAN